MLYEVITLVRPAGVRRLRRERRAGLALHAAHPGWPPRRGVGPPAHPDPRALEGVGEGELVVPSLLVGSLGNLLARLVRIVDDPSRAVGQVLGRELESYNFV